MTFKEFEREIVEKVQAIVGDSARVEVHDARKNNNVLLRGLTILREGQGVSPTIYLEGFYKMLEDDMDLEYIARRILNLYTSGLPRSRVDMEFFKNYEEVKDRIVYRLVNREKNRQLLEDIPYVEYLDLAICFYYSFTHPEIGEGMIPIHNSHMEMWNIGVGELMRRATSNTPQLMPAKLCGIDNKLEEELGEEAVAQLRQTQKESNRYLYVLSNKNCCFGAAAILYPGILAEAARCLGGSFYILPSSIHEMLLLLDDGRCSGDGLHEMIADINRCQVQDEDVLSDYAYHYDASTGRVTETH